MPLYRLRCDCGEEFEYYNPRSRHTCPKCSHSRGAKKRQKHGNAGDPLYAVYGGIKQRCRNPNYHRYPWYGAKGIDLCPEWEDWIAFRDWALAAGWQKGLQIDRIDESGNYSPTNCQIVTRSENVKRMRATYQIIKRAIAGHPDRTALIKTVILRELDRQDIWHEDGSGSTIWIDGHLNLDDLATRLSGEACA